LDIGNNFFLKNLTFIQKKLFIQNEEGTMKFKLILILSILVFLGNCAISSSLNSISNSVNFVSNSLNSLSTSLVSISKSIRSSSESISDSSKKEEKKQQQAYINDVKYFTVFAIKESIPSDEYIREVGRIARNYGLYNWKAYPATYVGIGKGIREARVNKVHFNELLSAVNHEEIKNFLIQGYYN